MVSAPIVGATKPHHLADAVAALDIKLTAEEIDSLEGPYVTRLPTFFKPVPLRRPILTRHGDETWRRSRAADQCRSGGA